MSVSVSVSVWWRWGQPSCFDCAGEYPEQQLETRLTSGSILMMRSSSLRHCTTVEAIGIENRAVCDGSTNAHTHTKRVGLSSQGGIHTS